FISASLYVRNSTEWKGAWHGEVPIVNPTAPPPAKTGDKDAEPKATIRSMADSETRELAAIEKSVWEGWMNRDAKKLDSLTARELAFVNIFGGYFTNRADTLKNWTENPCEIKSVDVTEASSVSVAVDTSILIHKGTANGTCFGQQVGPVLGTSIYVKDGSAWKLAFTMNMPAS
ncbi:MAG: nuclear transport factor 2 family protein, partial [Pyrinomonadaceae bacterium]